MLEGLLTELRGTDHRTFSFDFARFTTQSRNGSTARTTGRVGAASRQAAFGVVNEIADFLRIGSWLWIGGS
jgi:hypothetical protein